MSIDRPLLIKSCPLCEIFLNPEENIKTKLYYPESIDKVSKSEFVILNCNKCKTPLIVPNCHVLEINKELWGKILRECRNQFGYGMRLRTRMYKCRDHIHYHLIK